MDLSNLFSSLPEPYVALMIGPPLSGKTFQINKIRKDNDFVVISRDQIIMDIQGGGNYESAFKNVSHREVDERLLSQIRKASFSGDNVVVDMTNMTRKRRIHNLSFFDGYYKLAIIFPFLSEKEYIRRNKKRIVEEDKNIPMEIVKRMISSYQPISPEEGFDRVISLN